MIARMIFLITLPGYIAIAAGYGLNNIWLLWIGALWIDVAGHIAERSTFKKLLPKIQELVAQRDKAIDLANQILDQQSPAS